MKTLVVLAVMGVCSALPHQAYIAIPHVSYGSPSVGYYQPRYVGPLASSVPAGVDGKVVQVPDTYEVQAARNEFFNAYQRQLDAVGSHGPYSHGSSYRYSAPRAHVSAHPVSNTYAHVSHPVSNTHAHVSHPVSTTHAHVSHPVSTTHAHVSHPVTTSHVKVSGHPVSTSHTHVSTHPVTHTSVSTHHSAPHVAVPSHSSYSHGSTPVHSSVSVHRSAPSHGHVTTSYSAPVKPSVIVVANGHVQDTPEVAAAKADFFYKYNQLAAAAAAAPDNDIYGDSHSY